MEILHHFFQILVDLENEFVHTELGGIGNSGIPIPKNIVLFLLEFRAVFRPTFGIYAVTN